ncbi:UDP-N-acetylmuramate dehydrogenase [Methylocapsa sp. S129]|uniref:UDP-N-acetylmuramate dehydrogenase n=1 Tax=Methylocapsa sp. S129 TaxID=1641869 RepID=UPI00131D6A05|nr:UDP-N-acetylmuramate dehydrogenase [Methylocapsa sp. S129]
MTFPDIVPQIAAQAPALRGKLSADAPLAPFTWFRVGGPAQVLFQPADEEDLAYFLARLPAEIRVTLIGLGSNLIVRDRGVAGIVIRLGGRAFGAIEAMPDYRVVAGTAAPDVKVARAAAEAGVAGLEFYRGIPGSIGGALRMNAGAHGGETREALVEARGVDRAGAVRIFSAQEMGFSYRHSRAPADVIFTQAVFQGRSGDRGEILAEMDRITAAREASQPIREKTGGSTFKNPPGEKAWMLIDKAGCRGLVLGDAQVSPMHCNFLINRGAATAAQIEALGEEVRRRVRETSGIELEWEIKRVGEAG